MKKLAGLILFAVMALPAVDIRAQTAEKLDVDIRAYDNEKILIMPNSRYYSPVPVTFRPGRPDSSYSISIDDGANYTDYTPMDSASLTLYPDDETSPAKRWNIKFGCGNGDDEVFSDVYSISFDTESPVISLTDDDKISKWLTEETTVSLKVSDDAGIGRVISRSGDTVLAEFHETEGEEIKERTIELPLKKTENRFSTVETVCCDLAGNSTVMTFDYMYDDSPPTLSVNGVDNGLITPDPVKITMAADDEGEDAYISYTLERTEGDRVITTRAENICNTSSLDIGEDGAYTLTVNAYDPAGNRSETVTKHFRIDSAPPEISIKGAGDTADLRSFSNIIFETADESAGSTEVNITLKRTSMGKTDIIELGPYTTVAVNDIREVNINSDGDYEIMMSATDGAGNISSAYKRFRMDSNAPDISVAGISEGEVTGDKPIVRFMAGEMFYDSTIMTAVLEKKDKNGYRQVSKDEHVMKDVRDHIDIRPASEGLYRLTCLAADRSGNRNESTISFTVDYTPPVISQMSDIDGNYFRSFLLPKKIKDLVKDATKVVASAYVNDVPYHDGDRIIQEGRYVLTILASDEADNVSESSAEFIVDHTSPQVVLEGFDKNGNILPNSLIRVSLFDREDHLVSVKFGERSIPVDPDGTASFTVDESSGQKITVVAADDAGNVTDTEIHMQYSMASFLPGPLTVKEVSAGDEAKEEDAADPLSLMVGLLSVLSGSFGFVYRTFLRD